MPAKNPKRIASLEQRRSIFGRDSKLGATHRDSQIDIQADRCNGEVGKANTFRTSSGSELLVDWDDVWRLLTDRTDGGSGGTFVPTDIYRICHGGDDAILLSQIIYWFRRGKNGRVRAGIKSDGQQWVAKTANQWEAELGIPARRLRRVVDRLRASNFIITRSAGFAGNKTTFYRPNGRMILDAISRLEEGNKNEV